MKTPRKREIRSLEDRFWSKVDVRGEDDCWPWLASTLHDGYGQIYVHGTSRCLRSNRVVWELTNGPIPDGFCVLHSCDNPPCCNPAHLFLGTQVHNVEDMVKKNRGAKGSTNGHAKMSESVVDEIRKLHETGSFTQAQIAEMYGVHQSQVSRVVNRKRWLHVI